MFPFFPFPDPRFCNILISFSWISEILNLQKWYTLHLKFGFHEAYIVENRYCSQSAYNSLVILIWYNKSKLKGLLSNNSVFSPKRIKIAQVSSPDFSSVTWKKMVAHKGNINPRPLFKKEYWIKMQQPTPFAEDCEILESKRLRLDIIRKNIRVYVFRIPVD